MFLRFFVLLIALCMLMPACAEEWFVDDEQINIVPDPREQARFLMRNMTMEEKVGMMLMVAPEDLTDEKRTERISDADCFSALPAGGVILYGQNIASSEQLKALTDDIVSGSSKAGLYMPFIAVDEEGGQVIRIANKLGIDPAPSAEEIGQSGESIDAYNAGKYTASYLKEYGINLDLAPVADVRIADAPELETRSYGSDPHRVAEMATEMARGLNDGGLIACYKHFPGHGTIERNTHNVSTGHSRELDEMKKAELIPFREAIQKDAQMIMVSHLTARRIDSKYPASLSPLVINGLLRQDMGYDGVVITDALRMGAITDEYSAGEAAVLSILAGADVLLVPGNGQECYKAIQKAVKNGTIPMERIDESVERILTLKIKSGLIQ